MKALDKPAAQALLATLPDWQHDGPRDTMQRSLHFQHCYFVISSLDELLALAQIDFAPHYQRIAGLAELEPGALLADDPVLVRGTGAYQAARRQAPHAAQAAQAAQLPPC